MEVTDSYVKAAQIASSVRAVAEDAVKPGVKLLDLAVELENEIKTSGGEFAFPVNISLNEIAAHYTPPEGDETVFTEEHVAKVDFGVHVDGCIIDQAFTVDLTGENAKLVEASEAALADALSVMRAGASVSKVGAAIQKAIESRGFKPIENLSGHALEPFILHAGEQIPNVEKGSYILQEGDHFAVEPFATTGAGRVVEKGTEAEIYSLVNPRPVRLPQSRKLLEFVAEEYQTLPFCKRWLSEALPSKASLGLALKDLMRQEILHDYPPLVEVNGGLVSQAECTVRVTQDGVDVLS